MSDANPPNVLFKYRCLNSDTDFERLERVITEGECYFSSPLSFNDIFDCKPVMSFECTDDEYIKGYIAVARRQGDTRPRRTLMEEATNHISTDNDPRSPAFVTARQAEFHKLLNGWGVYCLAESPTNLLMWSHYAASHSGVCLEVPTKSFEFLWKIRYQKDRPIIRWLEKSTTWEKVEKALFTKSLHWEYEDEWRALANANQVGKLGPGFVTKIIFGPKCDPLVVERVKKIVDKSGHSMLYAHAVADPHQFALSIRDE
ncbi:DUF2971 domain-containing protein [Massilia sp. NP310]|uniref:DUF2971 domain-containing protein n=1 Tax=Massilia sp. NP310 TaxID=2861282 RepID=UPI001C625297|nr:DUF2971 domain-containing protein [Massilia sp. NP310]QYG01858.1 DUF2971 domain-containing protein [Massilia sp. NP310]